MSDTIKNLIATRSSRYAASTDPTEVLLMALGEIQSELSKLSVNVSIPDIDLSPLEAAIRELKSGIHPPQDPDFNPVFRSYEQTASAIKELLGEVKTTNHRLAGFRAGGGGPSSVGIRDEATGNKLRIDEFGALTITGSEGGASDGGLTNAQLRAAPVPVSGFPAVQPINDNNGSITVDGAVQVTNFPQSQTVSVANFPSSQPVSGTVEVSNFPPAAAGLTNTELRAFPVNVATGLAQPLTDSQLRASSVPVTGPLTDAQLRAANVPISGTVTANLGTIDGVATQATLASLLTATETVVARLDSVLEELRRRPDDKIVTGIVTSVAASTFVTILDFTFPVDAVMTGYGVDLGGLTAVRYRVRLVLNGADIPVDTDILHAEGFILDVNSWTPIRRKLLAGTRLRVQLFHTEALAQNNVRTSINYYEEP